MRIPVLVLALSLLGCSPLAIDPVSPQQLAEFQRYNEEGARLRGEFERLRDLGRVEEAEAAARLLEQHERTMPPALRAAVQRSGVSVPGNAWSVAKQAALERALAQLEPERPAPLFVQPEQMVGEAETVSDEGKLVLAQNQRVLLVEAAVAGQAQDWATAEARFDAARALGASPHISLARGDLEAKRGRLEVALGHYQRAEREAAESAGPRSALIAPALWRQADVLMRQGERKAAVALNERALGVLDAAAPDYPSALNNLGVAQHGAGELGAAARSYEAAIAALQAREPARRFEFHRVLSNLGLAQWQQGEPARALERFRAALRERGAEETTYPRWESERAALARAQSLAVELDVVMSLERRLGYPPGASLGLQALLERKGVVLERQARALEAVRDNAARRAAAPGGFLGGLFGSSRDRAERVAHEVSESSGASSAELLAEYEALTTERAGLPRGAAATEASGQRAALLDRRIEALKAEMASRGSVREDQARVQAPGGLSAFFDALTGDTERIRQRAVEAGEATLAARRDTALTASGDLLARIQQRLPADAVLLEFVQHRAFDPRPGRAEHARFGPARIGAYLVAASGEPVYLELGEAAALESKIRAFRHALGSDQRTRMRQLGRELDEALMRPVRAALQGQTRIYLAPDGALNLLPFAALVDAEGRYLLERLSFNYLTSGRDLLLLGRNEASRSAPVVIANPDFSLASAAGAGAGGSRSVDFSQVRFSQLPGTEAEARALSAIMPEAILLTGAGATETAAKRLSGPRILHVASHGFFLDDPAAARKARAGQATPARVEDPMLRSGLVFAGVNGLRSGEDDGVLTALEVAALDLRGTQLVVLSACETGVGEVRAGEGVFGLRRAFSVAGAETLVMSLWEVADEQTVALMDAYYRALAGKASRTEALRQAQLALLRQPDTASPFYWAAFISSGESGPLR